MVPCHRQIAFNELAIRLKIICFPAKYSTSKVNKLKLPYQFHFFKMCILMISFYQDLFPGKIKHAYKNNIISISHLLSTYQQVVSYFIIVCQKATFDL